MASATCSTSLLSSEGSTSLLDGMLKRGDICFAIDRLIQAVREASYAAKEARMPSGRRSFYRVKNRLLLWAIENLYELGYVSFCYQSGHQEKMLLITIKGSRLYCPHLPVRLLAGKAHGIVVHDLGMPEGRFVFCRT